MYAINASGHYHEKCIGEFKNVCGICNENVYAKELYVTSISDTHFHSECMRNAYMFTYAHTRHLGVDICKHMPTHAIPECISVNLYTHTSSQCADMEIYTHT